MTGPGVNRKLTAILSADVKGYSRLMADDEAGTVKTLTAHRQIISKVVEKNSGRVIDSPGDNLLAEFNSAVNAVQGAVEIQRELQVHNEELPEHRRMEWRIGINLGDVIFEGERIYGDGVNVAARIEAIAEAGGVCISRSVYDQVKGKLSFQYEHLGEHSVKNITEPVRVYRVAQDADSAPSTPMDPARAAPKGRLKIIAGLGAGAALAILALVAILIWTPFQGDAPLKPTVGPTPGLGLPRKPSIVVLPFVNMTGDPKQEYFSDGMTEAIIRGLSRVPKLFVIARNSAFVYKGRAVKVQRVGRELGVRYVLEGSVQRSGRRVRITAQLIDALTGRHIWSQKFDRDLKNIFALQDEITMKIMNAMRIELTEGEQARLRAERAPTRNLEAYELYLQGIGRMNRLTRAGNTAARKLLQRAIHLDPNFASAHATLGFAHFYDCLWGWTTTPKSSLMSAAKHSRQALALSPDLDVPYVVLGFVYAFMRKHDQAVASLERAVALNPNSSFAFAGLAVALIWSSQDRQALAAVKKSIRLNPFPMANHYQILGMAHMWLKQYSQAIVAYKKALARNPAYFWAWNSLVYIYVQLGRLAEAKAALTRLLKVKPDFSLALVATRPYKDPARNKALIEALKKAGLKMKGRP